MHSLCVFCGSNSGLEHHVALAREVGATLAARGITLVYGGASVGTMGALADAALGAGGRVIGVIPESLRAREIAHLDLTELHIVGGMAERKARMVDLSDGFLVLPGGYGTLDELFEVLTWGQLAMHTKPTCLLDPDGFYDDLARFLDRAVTDGFIRDKHRAMLLRASTMDAALAAMESYVPPAPPKWIGRP